MPGLSERNLSISKKYIMSFYKQLIWDMSLKHYGLQKSLHELKSLSVEITGGCNLQCRHCYMESKTQALPRELTAEEWMGFFDQIRQDFGNKITIQITGGEPLRKEGIYRILEHLKDSGFRVALATNGTLLDGKAIAEIKQCVSSISVSLDGFRESHDFLRAAQVFDLTVDNIRKMRAAGVKNIAIKTTVYRRNLAELEKLRDFLQEERMVIWHLFAMEPRGRGGLNRDEIITAEQYGELCSFVDRMKGDGKRKMRVIFEEQPGSFLGLKTLECNGYKLCHAGISTCSILPDGNVVNCIQGNREAVQGNIRQERFRDIWERGFGSCRSPEYRSCRQHHFETKIKK